MILKSQQRFKSNAQNVFTDEINKISVSSNGDRILQDKNIFDRITSLLNIQMIRKMFIKTLENTIQEKKGKC